MQTAARAIAIQQKPKGATALITWSLRILAAAILLQTLWFKFTGAPESVYIFTKVHAEPWGRIGSGIIELLASMLILVPRTTWLGALTAAGLMTGAIFSHLTVLGIVVQSDGGLLFTLALLVFACSLTLVALRRDDIPFLGAQR